MKNLGKYLKWFIIIAVIAVLVWIGYNFFRKTQTSQNGGSISLGQPTTPTSAAGQKLEPLTEKIFDYWINKKESAIYYLNENGEIFKLAGQNSEPIGAQTLNKLNQIKPSLDGQRIVAKFNYPNLPTFSIFDTETAGWQPLPSNTIAAAWSPESPEELLYADAASLKILNIITQKTKKISDIAQKDLSLDWISSDTVLLSGSPTVNLESSIWSLNLTNKNIRPLIHDEFGLTVQWLRGALRGIKLHSEKRIPRTSVIDSSGAVLATFAFTTMPSKCAAKDAFIYCAIPKNIREGTELPDDFYKHATYFEDVIYRIDLENDSAETILIPIEAMDAEHLDFFNNALLFKNRLDEKLYSLELE